MPPVEPMSQRTAPRPALLWGLALVVIIAAYSNVLEVGFMWDDHVLIRQNVEVHQLRPPWEYLGRSFWQHPFAYAAEHAYYRPLVTASFALDWALGGGTPAVFHLSNLLLHLAVCSLVFVFALRRGGHALTAAAVAMLFGVMPRLTESVTWVVGRTDVIATLAVLAGAWLASSRSPRVRPLAAVVLLLGLLAKEVALLGLALVAAERLLCVRSGQSRLREEAPLLSALVVVSLAWLALRSASGVATPLVVHDAATFLAGLGHYAVMVLTPWRPMAQIGFIKEVEGWAVVLGAMSLGAMAWAAWRWLRSREAWRALWLLAAFGGVVMVSLAVLRVYTIACDRFLYLPLALGAVVAASRPWPRPGLVLALVAGLALAGVTWSRNGVWAEPLRFWGEVYVTASPRNPGVPNGLGDALFDRGRISEAVPFFQEAEEARGRLPDSPSRLSLAVAASRLGYDAEALAQLDALLAENPGWRRAWYNLPLFRARALDFPGARAAVREVRRRFGDDETLQDFERRFTRSEAALGSTDLLERAGALQELGATAKAEQLYLQALVVPATAQAAATWLVRFGERDAAERGRSVLAGDEAAQAAWAERFSVEVPPPRSFTQR